MKNKADIEFEGVNLKDFIFLADKLPEKTLPDPEELLLWKELQHNTFWLDADISWDTVAFILRYIKELEINNPKAEIKLNIFSRGGELGPMFSLYDTLKATPLKVTTYNMGICHSAAFIIFLAGDKRIMTKHGLFVAHEGSGGTAGTYRENKSAMEQYNKDVDRMKEIIAEETDFTVDELNEQFEKSQDLYIGYEDALKKRVITK